MDASLLINFLEGNERASVFKKAIAEEMRLYKLQLKKRGASCDIWLTGYGRIKEFSVEQNHVKRICEECLNGPLDEIEVDYIANALILHEIFVPASKKIEYAIYRLCDNGDSPLNRETFQYVIDSFDNEYKEFRTSDDIFLDELDIEVSSIIKDALNEIEEDNYDKSRELLSPLVDKKDSAAIYYSAGFSLPGEDSKEFHERYIKLLHQSAEYGYVPAIHELAICYHNGDPVVQRDAEKAAQLFKEAAEKGHPHSQWLHGLDLLYERNGISKDKKLGISYIEKSALAKFEGALVTMSKFYEKGKSGFPVDVDKAQYYKNQINKEDMLGYSSPCTILVS